MSIVLATPYRYVMRNNTMIFKLLQSKYHLYSNSYFYSISYSWSIFTSTASTTSTVLSSFLASSSLFAQNSLIKLKFVPSLHTSLCVSKSWPCELFNMISLYKSSSPKATSDPSSPHRLLAQAPARRPSSRCSILRVPGPSGR